MPAATAQASVSSQHTPEQPHASQSSTDADQRGRSQWLFTEEELLLAPSIVDGNLTSEKERENRGKGVNFILQAGIMLKLPQITLATASVFLHRFYMRHSMVDSQTRGPGYHYYSMAATCLFLATKVEENCRKMKELVVACVRVAQKDPYKYVDEQDKEYWRWRDNILHSEDVLLEALCFDLSLEAPYKTLFDLLVQFRVENNKKLRNSAWAFVNDSYLTQLCLLFPSRVIAASAFYAAAKFAGISFPDDEQGRPWWHSIHMDIVDVRRACNYMADMYENVPPKPGREGIVYEKTPDTKDMTDRTRIPGTASSDPAAGSSTSPEAPLESTRGSKREARPDLDGQVDGSPSPSVELAGEPSPRKKRRLNGDTEAGDSQGQSAEEGGAKPPGAGKVNGDVATASSNGVKTEAKRTARRRKEGEDGEDSEHLSEEGELES